MSYRVGQILFVVLRAKTTVYPMQVVEEITKKTLNGEVTTYMVRGKEHDRVLPINDVDGEVFDSAEKARKVLIDRVAQNISNRVDAAISSAREWYPSGFESSDDDPLSMIKKSGATVQHVAPEKPAHKPQLKPELAELAAELAAEADEATVMEVPDGKGGFIKAKVKSVKVPKELQD